MSPTRPIVAVSLIVSSTPFALSAAELHTTQEKAAESLVRTLQGDEVEIEYIAHACFRLRSPGGKRILIDPYASRVWLGYDFPTGLEADAVLITHPHYDHDAGRRIHRDTSWMSKLSVHDGPESFDLGDFHITGIAGKHADPWGKEFGQTNTIWTIEVAGLRIAHLGDNGPLSASNVAELGRIDVLLAPIDAQEHILHFDELASIRTALHPRVLVPMHYRLPDLELNDEDPKGLGPIDPWLEREARVRRLDGHLVVFSHKNLSAVDEVAVFRHSPQVVRPAASK